MKISDINWTNIKALVEGTTSHLLDRFGPMWTKATDLVKEQVAYRSEVCKPCADNGACIHCGCTTPGLFYAQKGCRVGNYPIMLNEKSWEDFKKNKEEGNDELNNKYFSIWICSCGSKNSSPYNYCHKCDKKYTYNEVQEMVKDFVSKDINKD